MFGGWGVSPFRTKSKLNLFLLTTPSQYSSCQKSIEDNSSWFNNICSCTSLSGFSKFTVWLFRANQVCIASRTRPKKYFSSSHFSGSDRLCKARVLRWMSVYNRRKETDINLLCENGPFQFVDWLVPISAEIPSRLVDLS